MSDLTVIILTMNESKNILKCIESVKELAKRIIVVDSGSSDKTIEIAKEGGAEVYFNEFENYASQFNWALDNTNISTKWVLRLDADERLTPELCEEASKEMIKHKDDNVNGMILRQRVYFMNKWIKHGGMYPFRKLMIFKHGIGRIENRKMDEHTILSFGESIELKNDGIHYDFKNLNYWTNKQNWYATREMQDYFEIIEKEKNTTQQMADKNIKGRRQLKTVYYKFPIFFRPFFLFVFRYIFQLGFLDGKEGLIFHFLQSFWYRFLVDAKIFEHKKMGGKFEKTGALKS